MRSRSWPLAAARALYAGIGLGATSVGCLQLLSPDADIGLGAFLLAAGLGAGAAAIWVRSEQRWVGALASIGIAWGAAAAALPLLVVTLGLAYFGVWPRVAIAMAALAVLAGAARTMWRASRRPWNRDQSVAAR
jgi:peptidoglycan/LPS O-acetylase OafA/YrhL